LKTPLSGGLDLEVNLTRTTNKVCILCATQPARDRCLVTRKRFKSVDRQYTSEQTWVIAYAICPTCSSLLNWVEPAEESLRLEITRYGSGWLSGSQGIHLLQMAGMWLAAIKSASTGRL